MLDAGSSSRPRACHADVKIRNSAPWVIAVDTLEHEYDWYKVCLHEAAHVHVAHHFGTHTAKIRIGGGLRGGGHTRIDTPENSIAMLAVILAGKLLNNSCSVTLNAVMVIGNNWRNVFGAWAGTMRALRSYER